MPEELRGIRPTDNFIRNHKSHIIDPDVGDLPDNFPEIWDACKPMMNPNIKFGVVLVFGTSENSSAGEYFNDLWNNSGLL